MAVSQDLEIALAPARNKQKVDFGRRDDIAMDIFLRADIDEPEARGMILVGLFRDAAGEVIPPPYKGWWRTRAGLPYIYIPVWRTESRADAPEPFALQLPRGARSLEFGLMGAACKADIDIVRFEAVVTPPPLIAAEYDRSGGIEPRLAASEWNNLVGQAVWHDLVAFGDQDFWVLRAALEGLETGIPRGAIVRLTCFDADGEIIPGPYPGFDLPYSGQPFAYLSTMPAHNAPPGCAHRYLAIDRPKGAVLALVAIEKWSDEGDYRLAPDTALLPGSSALLTELVTQFHSQPRFASQGPLVTAALRYLHRTGRISDELRLIELSVGTTLADHARNRGQAIASILTETDPAWLPIARPRIGRGRIAGPANRAMMLVKVCVPYENSGGAVRNMNTARVLGELGWDAYAVTPLGYPGAIRPDEQTMPADADDMSAPDIEENGDELALRKYVPHVTDVGGAPHLHLNLAKRHFGRARADHLLRYETALLGSVYRRFGGRLIHAVSGYRGYENALKALALKAEFGVPVLYDFRSFHEHTWGAAGIDNLDAEMTRLRARQEDRCVRECDHTVVISEAMREMLIARGGDPARISVIPNGVELERFAGQGAVDHDLREELGILSHAPVHGYISNISAREGHATLLRAHAALIGRFPDLVCLIVGDGPLRAVLEKQAGELGMGDSVRFTGEVPHDSVHLYYALFDVFVVPRVRDYASDYVTPLKPYEAMAARVPIVMSELPVTGEILGGEGERGLRAPPGDHEALAARIATLLEDCALASAMAERARAWVARERRWSTLLAGYSEIYRALGGEPKKGDTN